MSKLNEKTSRRNSSIAFLDYRPAELRKHKDWVIVYYAKDPSTSKLKRYRVRVPKIQNKAIRERHGKKMVLEINRKLDTGWLPAHENVGVNEFKTLDECLDIYINYIAQELKSGNKRNHTLISYKSYVRLFREWMKVKQIKINFIVEINTSFITKYLDWIYIERGNSTTTYNNHLTFLKAFTNFCIKRGYIKENFANTISRKQKAEKKRTVFSDSVKRSVKTLERTDHSFYTACMMVYYCFVRSTELTKLKVKDIHLKEQFISIDSTVSKNKKSSIITIPDEYVGILENHLRFAKHENEYLFGYDNFMPSTKQSTPRQLRGKWAKFRKEYHIEDKYQFYSFKDTGITDLLMSGVPALKVRDQARHYDIKITEQYTPRNKATDAVVKSAKFKF